MSYLFGPHVVALALSQGKRRIEAVYHAPAKGESIPSILLSGLKKRSLEWRSVSKQALDDMVRGEKHQGWVAKVGDYVYTPVDSLCEGDPSLLVVADSLKDPQNLGALCRHSYCFGASGLIINKDQSVGITPTVAKASAGASECLAIAQVTNIARTLEDLKEKGYWIYATVAKATLSLASCMPEKKSVLVLGSEGSGIRPLIQQKCDFEISIPMARPFDSLNVAQTAGIVLYDWSQKLGLAAHT